MPQTLSLSPTNFGTSKLPASWHHPITHSDTLWFRLQALISSAAVFVKIMHVAYFGTYERDCTCSHITNGDKKLLPNLGVLKTLNRNSPLWRRTFCWDNQSWTWTCASLLCPPKCFNDVSSSCLSVIDLTSVSHSTSYCLAVNGLAYISWIWPMKVSNNVYAEARVYEASMSKRENSVEPITTVCLHHFHTCKQ